MRLYDAYTGASLLTQIALPPKLLQQIPTELQPYFHGPYSNWLSVLAMWGTGWFDNGVVHNLPVPDEMLPRLAYKLQEFVLGAIWPNLGAPIPRSDVYRAPEPWCVYTTPLVNAFARDVHVAVLAPNGTYSVDTIPFHLIPQWLFQHNAGAKAVTVRPTGRFLVWEAGTAANAEAAQFTNGELDPPPRGTVMITSQFPMEDDHRFFPVWGITRNEP